MADQSEQIENKLFAARKEAFQQARTTNIFKTIVLIGLVVGTIALGVYAIRYGAARRSEAGPVDTKEFRHKIIALEKELELLKSDVATAKKPNAVFHAVQSTVEFVVSNWVLLSFLAAIITAIYVKYRYKITYFESYRDLATKKMLSEFYRHLGDRMVISSEWQSAEAAYRDSLAINPTNIKSTYGLAKVGVFKPLKGQKSYAPEVAEAKLDYLIANQVKNASPLERRRDLAQLYFLKSIVRFRVKDPEASRALLEKAIEADPTYVGPQLNLGYLHEAAGNIEQAIDHFKKAVELEPKWALANNNLGGAYLITLQFDKAIEYLGRASKISPALITSISLGEAYAYARQFDSALSCHNDALSRLAAAGIENERYVQSGGIWLHSFMPLQEGDQAAIRRHVTVSTFDQKKILMLCAVAFDYALCNDLLLADKRFAEAHSINGAGDYSEMLLNRIRSILNLICPDPPARQWFEEKERKLSS